jgi:hypothetical protein
MSRPSPKVLIKRDPQAFADFPVAALPVLQKVIILRNAVTKSPRVHPEAREALLYLVELIFADLAERQEVQ